MTLLRRRPREVYRVYSEEEYLNGAGSGLASIGEWPLGESPLGEPPVGESPLSVETVTHRAGGEHRLRRVVEERRLHRMAGVAMLAAAVGTVGGVVFLNVARAHGGTGARGSFLVATRSTRVAHSPAVDDAQPQGGSSRPVVVRSVKTTSSSRVVHVKRSLGSPVPRRSNHLLTHDHNPPVRRLTDAAVVADYVPPRPSSGEAAPAQVSTTTAFVAPAPTRLALEKRSEFGFER
jgi:hypothetical protein